MTLLAKQPTLRDFIILFLLTVSAILHAGRYEELQARIAKGPHLSVVAATFYGGPENETLTGAAELPDGRLLAVGYSQPEKAKKDAAATPFIQAFSANLDQAYGAIKFPKGSALFTACKLAVDGKTLYVAGQRGPDFNDLKRRSPRAEGKGDQFILSLNTSTGNIHWISLIDLEGPPQHLFIGLDGTVYATTQRKGRASAVGVSSNGQPTGPLHMSASNLGGFFGIDPSGRYLLFGTDRNTHTGREPWRQPHFYHIDVNSLGKNKPEIALRLWEWKPNEQIRGDAKDGAYKLESDSSILAAAYSADYQTLYIGGWSDGGNSTLTRQPDDLTEEWTNSRLGISTWGMRGANSLSWIMRLDPQTHKIINATRWVGFIPEGFDNGPGNWPNAARIDQMAVLPDQGLVISGYAATGLAPTPNAFWIRPKKYAGKYGGRYVTAFTPDLNNILFSSYLPGYQENIMIPLSDGLLVVGTTAPNDNREETMAEPPVTPGAAQPQFGGGETDGHLIRLRLPN